MVKLKIRIDLRYLQPLYFIFLIYCIVTSSLVLNNNDLTFYVQVNYYCRRAACVIPSLNDLEKVLKRFCKITHASIFECKRQSNDIANTRNIKNLLLFVTSKNLSAEKLPFYLNQSMMMSSYLTNIWIFSANLFYFCILNVTCRMRFLCMLLQLKCLVFLEVDKFEFMFHIYFQKILRDLIVYDTKFGMMRITKWAGTFSVKMYIEYD